MKGLRGISATAAVAALGFASAAGAADFSFHGLLDLAVAPRGDAFEANRLTRGDNPFDAYGLRLFVEGTVATKFAVFSQVVLSDGTDQHAPYVDGAYVQYSPSAETDFHLVAGKMPWLLGTYAPRTYSNRNPLIGKPMMYQNHTTLQWSAAPQNADALLAQAGKGNDAFTYKPGGFATVGMAVVDDSYWDFGAMLTGSARPLEYALGFANGTPGWGSTAQDDNDGKSVLGRIGLAPLPGLRVGVSGSYGPYLANWVWVPAGRTVNDYNQDLVMADLEFLAGHSELRAEGYQNVWQTPTVGDLRVAGFYVEGKQTLLAGLYAATRYEQMRHSDLRASSGNLQPWDRDRDRIEAGFGYRMDRGVLMKAVYQRNTERGDVSAAQATHDLYAAQLSLSF
jgi:hypothetical protein